MDKRVIGRAIQEIRDLREQNKLMAVRLQVYDEMMSLFTAQKTNSGIVSTPDICNELEKEYLSSTMGAVNKIPNPVPNVGPDTFPDIDKFPPLKRP